MIKKVPTTELKLGMFIHDLNCGWMEHSFLRNSFMLRREGDLLKLQESAIREVYIDTVKGLDCSWAPTREEVRADLTARMLEGAHATPPPPDVHTTHAEELVFARQIMHEANAVIHSVLDDARLGRQIQVERVQPAVRRITASILRNQGTLVSLCRLREGDSYTFQHSVSVATLLVAFARAVGLDLKDVHEAGMGGMLHDLGKMRVPDHILNKPGKLTDEEYRIMKDHVVLGVEVLKATPDISLTVMQVASEHHERYEGSGYPNRLKGEAISQLGRMAAIVDVYDALTSNRIYHKGMEPTDALTKLFEWSDHHFDPLLVQYFIQAIGIYPVGSLVRLESGRLAVVIEQGAQDLLHPKVRVVFDLVRRQALAPFDLDLATGEDAIAASVNPGEWELDPFDYLLMENV
jgi:putative nucleotidyltransferase with HDIG domain